MKTFHITDRIEVECDSKNTRNGFRHRATLVYDGRKCETATCSYLNRTWESFDFQSVLQKLIEKTKSLTDEERTVAKKFAETGDKESDSMFKTLSMVMKIGEVFSENQKETNDWKTRMLKAGLENKGLIMPDDWDSLSEDDKEKRLNSVIDAFNK